MVVITADPSTLSLVANFETTHALTVSCVRLPGRLALLHLGHHI